MDKLTEFYSNKENINHLRKFLRRFIYVNGTFSKEDDVHDTIEDIIQTTYLKLYTNKGISCTKCSPTTIVFKSAKYNAFTELTRKKRWKSFPIEYFEDTLFSDAIQERNIEKKELKNILDSEINKLEKPFSKTLLLYSENYTVREISEIEHTSINTIKSRLRLSKQKLRKRKLLKDYLKS